jgi:hypothetical protein
MGLFGPSKKDRATAAAYDERAEPLEREARKLAAKVRHHREESRRTDRYADPQVDRAAARDAACDQESLRREARQYRDSAAYARAPWWRR